MVKNVVYDKSTRSTNKKEIIVFKNRFEAAELLANKLKHYADRKDVVILAIPRGALQIGAVLSRELNFPLDVVFVKKIGAPGSPEYAIGAVTMDELVVEPSFSMLGEGAQRYVEQEAMRLRTLLKEREQRYRHGRPKCEIKDKVVIIVDDGIATGKTLELTIALIEKAEPKKIVVAVPVGSRDALERISRNVDEVVYLLAPEFFYAVGVFYENFEQVEDEEASALLQQAKSC